MSVTKTEVYTTARAIELGLVAACPECNSSAIVHRTKMKDWRCHDCKHECVTPAYRKRMKLGGIRSMWNNAEIAFLRKHYGIMNTNAIARKLNRSMPSVYKQAAKHGLCITSPSPIDLRPMTRSNWTDDDVKYLRDNYEGVNASVMADVLGRTVDSIRLKASRLGISNGLSPFTEEYGGKANV